MIKVEDVFKGRTRPTRTDKWTDELHEIDIDKANEIELTVYDRSGDYSMPIGMLWIRISDLVEEMRRQRIQAELNNSGWVSADQTVGGNTNRSDLQFSPPPKQNTASGGASGAGTGQGTGINAGPIPQVGPVYIDSWFSLEPVGRIQLTMSFGKLGACNDSALLLTRLQSNRQKTADLSTSDSIVKALFDNAKKKSTNNTGTSSCSSSFTTSCGVLYAATS